MPGVPGWLTDAVGPVLGGEQLRRWGLSEVWRVRLGGAEPRTVIVKRGLGEMAGEAELYRRLIVPLGIAAPRLLSAAGEPVVLVLQDLGSDNLEQRPSVEGYRAAVRALAGMRAAAAERLAGDPSIGVGWGKSTADFADAVRRAGTGLAALRPDLAGVLDSPARVLLARLDLLAGAPDTIVHGDFHAKNLVYAGGGGIVAVDWPGAYLHSHLGDLYCLAREARWRGFEVSPAEFASVAGLDVRTVAELMDVGGMCWIVLVLRWLVEEGLRFVPEARGWVDELIGDFRGLAGYRTS